MTYYAQQAPIILTDALFEYYGGNISNSSIGQRKAAYVIAECAAQEDLGTFLTPTIVTGTYLFQHEIVLEHAYVNSVIMTRLKAFDEDMYHDISGTANWEVAVRNSEYGIIDLYPYYYHYCAYACPYHVEIVYNAGLPSGTVYTPPVLSALTTYADIELNELIGYGNEGSGDAGILEFSNQDYSEKRMALLRTAYGNSPRGNRAHRILTGLRRYRYVGMGAPIR